MCDLLETFYAQFCAIPDYKKSLIFVLLWTIFHASLKFFLLLCVHASERINQTVEIIKHTVDIEEKGVKLKLTIVDTPGFGDAVNNNEWWAGGPVVLLCALFTPDGCLREMLMLFLCVSSWKPITDYIDHQFEQYFRDESGLNRKNIQDNRVHCCLYFIPPFGHG